MVHQCSQEHRRGASDIREHAERSCASVCLALTAIHRLSLMPRGDAHTIFQAHIHMNFFARGAGSVLCTLNEYLTSLPQFAPPGMDPAALPNLVVAVQGTSVAVPPIRTTDAGTPAPRYQAFVMYGNGAEMVRESLRVRRCWKLLSSANAADDTSAWNLWWGSNGQPCPFKRFHNRAPRNCSSAVSACAHMRAALAHASSMHAARRMLQNLGLKPSADQETSGNQHVGHAQRVQLAQHCSGTTSCQARRRCL